MKQVMPMSSEFYAAVGLDTTFSDLRKIWAGWNVTPYGNFSPVNFSQALSLLETKLPLAMRYDAAMQTFEKMANIPQATAEQKFSVLRFAQASVGDLGEVGERHSALIEIQKALQTVGVATGHFIVIAESLERLERRKPELRKTHGCGEFVAA